MHIRQIQSTRIRGTGWGSHRLALSWGPPGIRTPEGSLMPRKSKTLAFGIVKLKNYYAQDNFPPVHNVGYSLVILFPDSFELHHPV